MPVTAQQKQIYNNLKKSNKGWPHKLLWEKTNFEIKKIKRAQQQVKIQANQQRQTAVIAQQPANIAAFKQMKTRKAQLSKPKTTLEKLKFSWKKLIKAEPENSNLRKQYLRIYRVLHEASSPQEARQKLKVQISPQIKTWKWTKNQQVKYVKTLLFLKKVPSGGRRKTYRRKRRTRRKHRKHRKRRTRRKRHKRRRRRTRRRRRR